MDFCGDIAVIIGIIALAYLGPLAFLMVAAAVWVIVDFILTCVKGLGGHLQAGINDGPIGDEPAYKQYFFRRAFLDLRDILIDSGQPQKDIGGEIAWAISQGSCLEAAIWIAIGAPACVVAIAVKVAFAVTFAAIILTMVILNCVLMLVVRLAELGLITYHRFINHCPACYERFALPVYECPCGARHKRLLPGTYGIFHRKCRCRKKLATSYLFGRQRIDSFCPHCGCRLEGEDPTLRPVLLPVVAGRSSGKTSYQVALLMRLQERRKQGEIDLAFVSSDDQYKYDAAVSMFRSGQLLPQTLERVPKALQLNFSVKAKGEPALGKVRGKKVRLHLFDAAGEAYQDEQHMAQLKFLSHCHSVMMLIDPLSIESARQRYAQEMKTDLADVNPSDVNPEDVYDRLLEFLERNGVRVIGRKVPLPLAVVVTKRDAFGLPDEIGQGALANLQQVADLQTAQKRQPAHRIDPSPIVRQWLLDQELTGVVSKIESQFQSYRYFSCSVFGRPPSKFAGQPFEPEGVEAPFAWLLQASRICGWVG